MPRGKEVGVLDRERELGKREGRFSVRESNWSWFASKVCERDCGPRDWKRERKDVAIDDAEAEVRRGWRVENVRVERLDWERVRTRDRVDQRVAEDRDIMTGD